jgi:tripartite-type tricarboxylate transporter receptor subunit TctC
LSDNIARRVNVPLGAALGQPVIVENLGGGSGSIAAQKVLNGPSDGYGVRGLAQRADLARPDLGHQVQPELPPDPRIALAPMAIFMRGCETADDSPPMRKVAKEGKPMAYASVGVGSFYLLGAK